MLGCSDRRTPPCVWSSTKRRKASTLSKDLKAKNALFHGRGGSIYVMCILWLFSDHPYFLSLSYPTRIHVSSLPVLLSSVDPLFFRFSLKAFDMWKRFGYPATHSQERSPVVCASGNRVRWSRLDSINRISPPAHEKRILIGIVYFLNLFPWWLLCAFFCMFIFTVPNSCVCSFVGFDPSSPRLDALLTASLDILPRPYWNLLRLATTSRAEPSRAKSRYREILSIPHAWLK